MSSMAWSPAIWPIPTWCRSLWSSLMFANHGGGDRCDSGYLLAGCFALSEWLVMADAAIRGPLGKRRILVGSIRETTNPRWRIAQLTRCLRRSSLDRAMPFKSLGIWTSVNRLAPEWRDVRVLLASGCPCLKYTYKCRTMSDVVGGNYAAGSFNERWSVSTVARTASKSGTSPKIMPAMAP